MANTELAATRKLQNCIYEFRTKINEAINKGICYTNVTNMDVASWKLIHCLDYKMVEYAKSCSSKHQKKKDYQENLSRYNAKGDKIDRLEDDDKVAVTNFEGPENLSRKWKKKHYGEVNKKISDCLEALCSKLDFARRKSIHFQRDSIIDESRKLVKCLVDDEIVKESIQLAKPKHLPNVKKGSPAVCHVQGESRKKHMISTHFQKELDLPEEEEEEEEDGYKIADVCLNCEITTQNMMQYKAERNLLILDMRRVEEIRNNEHFEHNQQQEIIRLLSKEHDTMWLGFYKLEHKYGIEMKAAKTTINTLQRENICLEQEIVNGKCELDQIRLEQVNQQEKINDLLQENRKLEDDNKLFRNEMYSIENEKIKFEKRIQQMKQEVQKLNEKIDELQKENIMLNATVDEKVCENLKLDTELQSLAKEKERITVDETVTISQTEMDELRKELIDKHLLIDQAHKTLSRSKSLCDLTHHSKEEIKIRLNLITRMCRESNEEEQHIFKEYTETLYESKGRSKSLRSLKQNFDNDDYLPQDETGMIGSAEDLTEREMTAQRIFKKLSMASNTPTTVQNNYNIITSNATFQKNCLVEATTANANSDRAINDS